MGFTGVSGPGVVFGDPCVGDGKSGTADCKDLVDLALGAAGLAGAGGADGSCCPLDLIAVDAMSALKMGLFETFAEGGPFLEPVASPGGGGVTFVALRSSYSQLPRIQYCVPTRVFTDEVDLVIVRSGDPPPYRRCGPSISVIPGQAAAFVWDGNSCEIYASVLYKDYEVQRLPGQGDMGAFESLLFWITAVGGYTGHSKVSIQFTRQAEALTTTSLGGGSEIGGAAFGPECVVDDASKPCDPVAEAQEMYFQSSSDGGGGPGLVRGLSAPSWTKLVIPKFYRYTYGYAVLPSSVGYLGAPEISDCITSKGMWGLYQSTSRLWVKGVSLAGCKVDAINGYIDFGNQHEAVKNIDLPRGETWIDTTYDTGFNSGMMSYEFRFHPPSSATYYPGDIARQLGIENPGGGLTNPFADYLLTLVDSRFASHSSIQIPNQSSQSNCQPHSSSVENKKDWVKFLSQTSCAHYENSGILLSWGGEMMLTSSMVYVLVRVDVPGVSIKGIKMITFPTLDVVPVYTVDYPAAVGTSRGGCDLVNDNLSAARGFCKGVSWTSSLEVMQESQEGLVIDMSIPWWLPRASTFSAMTEKCSSLARSIKALVSSSSYDGGTYICGPGQPPLVGSSTNFGTINSVNVSYNDGTSYTMTVECGPPTISNTTVGQLFAARNTSVQTQGVVVGGSNGIYTVAVPVLGGVKAYNQDKYPWSPGDRVNVTIYNWPSM